MGKYKVVLLLMVAFFCGQLSAQRRGSGEHRPLKDIVAAYAGASAEVCGDLWQIPRKDENNSFAKAKECLERNKANKKPFSLTLRIQGIDSSIAQGLFARPTGDLFMFHYDSDPSGGSRIGARFSVISCDEKCWKDVLGILSEK